MKKKTTQELLIDLTLHSVPASLVTEFAEKIVKPYYKSSLNAAIQNLIHKAIAEHDFVYSHVTHIRTAKGHMNPRQEA